jgi:hypothetical protein
MRNIPDKSCRTKTQILCSGVLFFFFFFPLENRAVHEIMWKNIAERGQTTDGNMAHAYRMLDT